MHMLMNSTHLQTALINVVLIRARFLHISEKCSQLCLWECHIHTQILWKSWHALFASRTVNRLLFFLFFLFQQFITRDALVDRGNYAT